MGAPLIDLQEFLDNDIYTQVHSEELGMFLCSDMDLDSHRLGRNAINLSFSAAKKWIMYIYMDYVYLLFHQVSQYLHQKPVF